MHRAARRFGTSMVAGARSNGLRRAVAPKTAPHGEAGDAHGATKEISPEMQKYLGTQARLFGEKPPAPGKWRKIEPWEWTFWAVSLITAVGLWKYSEAARKADMFLWARDEAEERVRRRAAGLPVEFGMNYAALRALEEERRARVKRTGELSEAEKVNFGHGEM